MCNACGFQCCAWDGFSGCGCDFCAEPLCWDPDDDGFDVVDENGDEMDDESGRTLDVNFEAPDEND
jgi:hypothetical protein